MVESWFLWTWNIVLSFIWIIFCGFWDLEGILLNPCFFLTIIVSIIINPHNIYVHGHLHFVLSRACVEVKPILFVEDGTDTVPEAITGRSRSETPLYYWGFKPENWHDSCIQKCVVSGKICAIILYITSELATKICFDSQPADNVNNGQCSLPKAYMEKISKFCIYLLDKVITDNDFAWEDIMVSIFLKILYKIKFILRLSGF